MQSDQLESGQRIPLSVFLHEPNSPQSLAALFPGGSVGMSSGALELLIPLLLFLAALSALFSGMEVSVFSLRDFDVRSIQSDHPEKGAALEQFLKNPKRTLSVILLADGLVNVPLGVLALFLLREETPVKLPLWLAWLIVFGLIIGICDYLPKLLALRYPTRWALFSTEILKIVDPMLGPVARILESLVEKIVTPLIPKSLQLRAHLSEEELETLIELGKEEGTLLAAESEMITEIMKLGSKTAKDCMTPRVDCVLMPDTWSNEKAISEIREKRSRRVPIYGETRDEILGVLDAQRFLFNPAQPYVAELDAPSFVPETMKALDLLKSFLARPQGIAIVVDEFGGVGGVVTLSDLIEEIISDAVPRGDRELYIERVRDNQWLVSGSARLDDLSESVAEMPQVEGVGTISGLVLTHLEQFPSPGAKLDFPGMRITVRRTTKKRIKDLLIEVIPKEEIE